MTRQVLIDTIYSQQDELTLTDIEDCVSIILKTMETALCDDQRIEIRDFGCFELRHRRVRMARNPKTGQAIAVSATQIPHFKPSKRLRECVDNTD